MRSLASFIAAAVLFSSPSWVPNPAKETDSRPKDYVAQSGHCPEDLDGDGQVRVPDLIMLLAAWGPCPFCGDGVVNPGEECDPPNGLSCDGNCQLQPTDCCFPQGPFEPGCEDPICESLVCAVDLFCCNTFWDELCVITAAQQCPECFGFDCCNDNAGTGFVGCSDPDCEEIICGGQPDCCSESWGPLCAGLAAIFCEQCMP